MSSNKQVAAVEVMLPEGAAERGPFGIAFFQLRDRSWVSGAIVAVRRGLAGRKVYAEAIHLPPMARPPGRLLVSREHLRPLFNLEPVVVGWVAGALGRGDSLPGGIQVTAHPGLCDQNYMGPDFYGARAPWARAARYLGGRLSALRSGV